jgi:hypothetical protein
MAIKFNTSSVQENSSQLYTISEFKGCDYTTTPTLVDDSRAIEISNYLPFNNSLVKRGGWVSVNELGYGEKKTLNVHNIWAFKNHRNKETNYILYASYPEYEGYNACLYWTPTLSQTSERYKLNKIFEPEYEPDNMYSYGVLFDERLFILAMNKYVMFYYVPYEATNEYGEKYTAYRLECDEVKNQAYIPTVLTGLGHTNGIESPTNLEEFNLLRPECYVEILRYNPKLVEDTVVETTGENGEKVETTIKQVQYDFSPYFEGKDNLQITAINDKEFINDTVFDRLGKLSYDSKKKILTITDMVEFTVQEEGSNEYFKVKLSYDLEENIVENMRFGISYGSLGYRDRLFLSGNPKHPNMDIHSCETNNSLENWKDYTYFGDLSYQMFGSSAQKIIGYGIMSNGAMAIFKETMPAEPNLYFRTSGYTTKQVTTSSNTTTEIYVEQFPISVSGISIGSSEMGQVITFGNDLLINIPKGIYKIMAGTSTATQIYEAKEMSYFIRDDLGTDISDSCSIVYHDKLYICRQDYRGVKRVYVADINKYSFKDSVQIYEWWILDNINAQKFFVLDDTLYFVNKERGLCKMTDFYYDSYNVKSLIGVSESGEEYSKDIFVDKETNTIRLSEVSEIIKDIHSNSDREKAYKIFKSNTQISFGKDSLVRFECDTLEITTETLSSGKLTLRLIADAQQEMLLEYAHMYNQNIIVPYKNGDVLEYGEFDINSCMHQTKNGVTYLIVSAEKVADVTDYNQSEKTISILIKSGTSFDIHELYERDYEYRLSDCFVNDGVWYCNQVDHNGNKKIVTVGSTEVTFFNKVSLKLYNDIPVDFELYKGVALNDVVFNIRRPVEAYWYSKYNCLGRLDYLKTADNITFVPETKRGGITQVGYRTAKNEVAFQTQAESQDFDFSSIDFNDFNFGGANMAKSYSSKKKIKNFAFVQLRLSSNDQRNSTAVSLSFRYKYTRINKGVK